MINDETRELIAFYNVENLFLPDPPPVHKLDPTLSGLRNWDVRKYRNKLFKISHVFQLIKESEKVLPMLIGLAEIQGREPLEELVQLEPFKSNYGILHYESMDERGVDVALLYDKAKIEVVSSEPISYFFEIEDDNPANYDTTRDILFCKMKFRGKIINVFVVHLPSKREKDVNKPKRDYILNDMRNRAEELLSKTEPVIILGDFNENPDDENLIKLLYGDSSDKILKNPYVDLFRKGIFSTFHFKDGLLFDQIILSDDFFDENALIQFKNAKVFNSEKLRTWDRKPTGRPFRTFAGSRYLGGYSDHFPVFVACSIKEPKP
ncbi:endonuclease/exonuclease/phosphatase family protein [Chryseobacterium koreense]|uniref:endonuclease/exonuclease/phosphatase family protein n=1 Tax=Chryseobacterium koreense TaxID=232216 RepID=UPI0026EAD5F0|nr:endonuclease/exonuclease/phosphatase family protein [Chryseobacterium koreense]